jgi:hypothetical protein
METRARERTSAFTTDEAPTKPHTLPMLKPRKVVVRKITPAPMRAVAPPVIRKKIQSVRDAETIPAPPPDEEPARGEEPARDEEPEPAAESSKPEEPPAALPELPKAPVTMTAMATPFVAMTPLPPVPAALPTCETGPSSSPDLLPMPPTNEPDTVKTASRSTPWRWLPRIAVLVVLVGAELAFAERTGAVDVQAARTMLAPVIGSR